VSRPPRRALRAALALVALSSPIVPRARRVEWRRQWAADLQHQSAFLDSHGGGRSAAVDLLWRARGAFTHAWILRLRSVSMPTFMSDVRYGARMLVKRPGFAAVAVILLGLGVGANTAIYSWIDAVLLAPLHGAAHADSVVVVKGTTLTRRDISVSYPNYGDMRDRLPESIDGLVAFRTVAFNIRIDGDAERAWGELVSANIFSVLGVSPLHGRLLVPDDDRAPGASAVAVVSYDFWQRRFGGSPSAVGRVVAINGTPFTIVGVAPPDFSGATTSMRLDVWVPMMMQPAVYGGGDRLNSRGNAWLNVLARLSPGHDLPAAQRDLARVAAQLTEEFPDVNAERGVALYPMWRDPQSAAAVLGPVFGLLVAVTAVVLLIVCANLASLLIARGTVRQREIAVRLALGASRTRIVRQLLTESLLLAIAGGALGLIAAVFMSRGLGALVPPTPLPIATEVDFSGRVALVSFALALATTLFFGLAPALQASRPALVPTLKESRGLAGSGRRRVRSALVVGQVALSILLLVGAGLFVRTFENARSADAGFDLHDGVLASLDLLPAGYDAERGALFFRDLLADLREVPGIESAAIARDIPLTLGNSGSDTTVEVEGYVPAEGEELTTYYDRISPGFFDTMGIPLVSGRAFDDRDTGQSEAVIIVNRTMAERYWPGGEAVGKRVNVGDWMTVVGVVEDVSYRGVGVRARPYMYLPLYSQYRPDVTLIVRTTGDPVGVLGGIRTALSARDGNVPLFDVRTMEAHREMGALLPRMAAVMLAAFGGVSLVLASVGLYGLLAFVVTQRTPEIGVRLALGADRDGIVRLVVGQGLRLAAVGGAIGLGLAALLLPLASSQLVGVGPRDGFTYALASAVLVGTAVFASYLPARRAAGVDPIQALRYE
jgi:predicted permease